jgi:hypothetical protein
MPAIERHADFLASQAFLEVSCQKYLGKVECLNGDGYKYQHNILYNIIY